MASLAALLDKEASAEIEAILSEAKKRASEIVAEAKEEADAQLSQAARSSQLQHEAALVRARGAAQLESSSVRLRAQHEAVERVFSEAERRVAALIKDSTRYGSILLKLLSEAMDALGEGARGAELTINPEDQDLIDAYVKKSKLDLVVKTDPSISGGVRLTARGANVTVENTLPNRLSRVREDMSGEVAQLLVSAKRA